MQNFYLPAGKTIPEVFFNASTGVLAMSGDCYHEYTSDFFEPILDWLRQYTLAWNQNIEMNFHLSYFNTSSSRYILQIIYILEEYQKTQKGKAFINWYAQDDQDLVEAGRDYAYETQISFNIIA